MVKKGKQTAANKTAKPKVVSKTKVKKTSDKPKALNAVYDNDKQSFFDKVQSYIKNNTLNSVLIAVLLIGGIGVGVWQFMIYQERQQFNKAEAVLDELSVEIEDALGQDLEITKTKSCGYRSVKIGDPGPPSCSVGVYFVLKEYVESENPSSYIGVAQKVDSVIFKNKVAYKSNTLMSDIESLDEYGDDYISADLKIEGASKLTCYISYGPGDTTNFKLSEDSLSTLGLSCYKQSMVEHFPVVD